MSYMKELKYVWTLTILDVFCNFTNFPFMIQKIQSGSAAELYAKKDKNNLFVLTDSNWNVVSATTKCHGDNLP